MAGFAYDPTHPAIVHLSMADPVLAEVIGRIGPLDRPRDDDPFTSLVFAIVGQQLSMKAADTICKRVEALLGEVTPQAILSLGGDALRPAGLSGAKARYLVDLATWCASGELDPYNLDSLTDDEVLASVMRVKGVGRWTAEMFLIFALGREDVFSMGDGGLRRAIGLLYDVSPTDDDAVHELSLRWEPHRSVASLYLWQTLASNQS